MDPSAGSPVAYRAIVALAKEQERVWGRIVQIRFGRVEVSAEMAPLLRTLWTMMSVLEAEICAQRSGVPVCDAAAGRGHAVPAERGAAARGSGRSIPEWELDRTIGRLGAVSVDDPQLGSRQAGDDAGSVPRP